MDLSEYITWIFGIIVAVLLGVLIFKLLPTSYQSWFSSFFTQITSGLTNWAGQAMNGSTGSST